MFSIPASTCFLFGRRLIYLYPFFWYFFCVFFLPKKKEEEKLNDMTLDMKIVFFSLFYNYRFQYT